MGGNRLFQQAEVYVPTNPKVVTQLWPTWAHSPGTRANTQGQRVHQDGF